MKKTVLYDWHVQNGANMAPFGQYEMPLWYTGGVKAEHLAVIQSGGVFDTSHMAVVTVSGKGSRDLLQYCFSKDMDRCVGLKKAPLHDGRCVYGVFLNEDGTVLDDAIVYQLSADQFMVVVNAGMGADIAERLNAHNKQGAEVRDLTDNAGKMDIQGPVAGKVMATLLENSGEVFQGMAYFSFKGGFDDIGSSAVKLKDGTPVLLSRTGYTGEFGFEIFMARDQLANVWQQVLDAGASFGVLPCGLAARDSLRAGAVLPLSHQDVGNWLFKNNPWQFALAWDDEQKSFTKSFFGADAVLKAGDDEFTLAFAGFDPRKIVVSEGTFVTNLDGEQIGTILTCATDMAIGRVDGEVISIASADKPEDFVPKGVSCGFVKVRENLAPGTEVILTDGKRKKIKVEIRGDVRPGRTARRPMKEMV
ncbi:aminomethyltransferase family protein [Desulfopila sp. IMCC35008]|uniref:aminomethyltransferase family protein n=1 Tax=Desulfopila sp. IMCC35008 TaxID=2653858 RepID=UPI001F0EDF02|nr:aminomethyltransferase family protein [Desulfopila sp. IMCC35008]